jgi:tetratricopeptide (TPR) repeat protein
MRGELDWIVMKALEKDRNRRYETANAFAIDVQRYLADESVLACPPSVGYRVGKFVRRNKRTLAWAALLGAMLLVVAGTLGWVARDRATQRGRNAGAIAVLLEQCEASLQGDRPDRAALALAEAERRAADGGAEDLADRLARCRDDLELLRALDAIDTLRWTWARGALPDPGVVVAQWRVALANYGVALDEERAAEAAEQITRSRVRDRVLTALDLWLAAKRSVGGQVAVRAILRYADRDAYREAVRDAVAARDFPRFPALAGQPEALAQPARFAVVLGQLHGVSAERGRAVLQSALSSRPGNLFVLMALGQSYPTNDPVGARESVRWFQAATAAHPENVAALNNLGVALFDFGDRDGAIAAYRDAIRADPLFARGHYNLGNALKTKGQLNEAITALREAIRVDPGYAEARFHVGGALWEKGDRDGALACFQEAARLHPKDARAHNNLGFVLQATRDWEGAVTAYQEAIRLDANLEPAHGNLASILATGPDRVRDGKRAVHLATRACALTAWKNPRALANLAVAYAEVGDFAKGIELQKKALSFPAYAKEFGKVAQERLELFARKHPYRDPGVAPDELGAPPPEVRPKE